MARNQRITIYKPVAGFDSLNQPITSLVEHRQTWADFRLLNGIETVKAGADASVVKGSARVGYCTDLTENMVVEYLGKRFAVKAVLPDLQHKRHVDLAVESIK